MLNLRKRINNKGITLIELIIVLAIMGLALPLAVQFFLLGTNVFARGASQSKAQHNARLATMYITTELRNAQSVMIIDSIDPSDTSSLDPDYNYIFVDGSTIKHIKTDLGINVDIIKEMSIGFTPILVFNNKSTNKQMIEFYIGGVDVQSSFSRDYDLISEVTPMNIDEGDEILGVSGGHVVAYTNPLSDSEIVRVDKLNLDIYQYNLYLVKEVDGSFRLRKPSAPTNTPNQLFLPVVGKYGSTITWSSNSTFINPTTGVVYRSNGTIPSITLTATLTKGSPVAVVATKQFTVKIDSLDPLTIYNSTINVTSGVDGVELDYYLSAMGGNPGYIYTTDAAGESALISLNLILEENGRLHGKVPTGLTGSYTIPITVKDEHISTSGSPIPNTANATLSINVN
jgi:prepilin-type N-terminal cleavage/methylation domain-containing protein